MQFRTLQKYARVLYVNGIGRSSQGGRVEQHSPGSVPALCRASLFPGGLEAVAREHANHGWHHSRISDTSEALGVEKVRHTICGAGRFAGIYRPE
jgi:hypothetical protein